MSGRKVRVPAWITSNSKVKTFFELNREEKLARSCCYHLELHRYLKRRGYDDLVADTTGKEVCTSVRSLALLFVGCEPLSTYMLIPLFYYAVTHSGSCVLRGNQNREKIAPSCWP